MYTHVWIKCFRWQDEQLVCSRRFHRKSVFQDQRTKQIPPRHKWSLLCWCWALPQVVDKYVSRAVGNNTYTRWKKSHQTKTLLGKILASDIAYNILVYENNKEVWEEELIIKTCAKTDEERKNAEQRHNPRYHEGKGKRLNRYRDGQTEEGRKYYQELLKTFQDLKSSVFWNESLQGYGIDQELW